MLHLVFSSFFMMFLSDLSVAEKIEYIFTVGEDVSKINLGADYADYTDLYLKFIIGVR